MASSKHIHFKCIKYRETRKFGFERESRPYKLYPSLSRDLKRHVGWKQSWTRLVDTWKVIGPCTYIEIISNVSNILKQINLGSKENQGFINLIQDCEEVEGDMWANNKARQGLFTYEEWKTQTCTLKL